MSTPRQRLRLAQSQTPKEQRSLVVNPALQTRLTTGLEMIPHGWALTPVDANKAPYRASWQTEFPLSRDQLVQEIKNGAQGYGIRTGKDSGGILAIDFDGASARAKLLELSGGIELPETVSFTSGRLGRSQHLFLVPNKLWASIKSCKIATGVKDGSGKAEHLELRWQGLQSVLPPSVHPMTGQYRWLRAPQQINLEIAPDWVIALMLAAPKIEFTEQLPMTWAERERALSYLAALHPNRTDDRDHWLKVGMALHSVDSGLLPEWERWSQQSKKYKPGECQYIWSRFCEHKGITIATLGAFAKEDGWKKVNQPQQELARMISEAYHPCLLDFRKWYFEARETGRSQQYLDRIQELAEEFKAKTPAARVSSSARNRDYTLSVSAIAHLQEDATNYRSRLEQFARDTKTILDFRGTEALDGEQPIRQCKSYTRGYTLRYYYATRLITVEKIGKQILICRYGETKTAPKAATQSDFDCFRREVNRLQSFIF
jgi:Bifunctional DNA primase/polymerase, N-terminal/Primase C terminal 2 (PriCT-2)